MVSLMIDFRGQPGGGWHEARLELLHYNKCMHILLCHEQADFDALGAMLGAWLLNPNMTPVLPRRFNRNGRSFLELYHAELPFVDPRDLPSEPIEAVTLVDTQSMPTLKGMTRQTRVEVIDHHPQRADLPAGWQIEGEQLGACTTLFVENLQKLNVSITSTQATLMLLGIYEDTGSLTYAGVTPRDVRSAAYLLDQGASLQLLSQFLNPPLTGEQRKLFDLLLATMETHSIQGTEVLVACANALEMTDEVSTVAHKLRDLLDPDVLLLLVNTVEGVRLVARSTIDTVNVANLAAHFGGGGHSRAAAALIHPNGNAGEDIASAQKRIYHEILDLLPTIVHPTVTVGQIMSRSPRLLTPEHSAEYAAQLMQRYGYEGYPVVSEDGKVLGLLTRRAVDRALAYKGAKMNLTAGSLMHAGEFAVHSQDSLEHLQHVMTSSGWGQMPVVDTENAKVVGIVTRTDLFKSMTTEKSHYPGRINLAERLDKALAPARLALLKMIADEAHARHLALYIVGGFVRDLYLDRPSPDLDLVVEGDAILLGQALAQKYGGRVVSHRRFGTAKWSIEPIRQRLVENFFLGDELNPADLPDTLDLISARTEFYDYPTALPTVEHGSIKLDLHRRDFSINTMALRLDSKHYGELYDYWGGLNDLRLGVVRVLHPLSFVDDPTRMLRAVRFEQRFGFQIDSRTLQLIKEARPLLEKVSGERLRHELDLILSEEKRSEMLSRLEELGLLSAIHPLLECKNGLPADFAQVLGTQGAVLPALAAEWNLPRCLGNFSVGRVLGYLIWLAALEPRGAEEVAERLRFPQPVRSALLQTCRLFNDLPALENDPPSRIAWRLDGVSPLAIFAASLLTTNPKLYSLLHTYVTAWQKVKPHTDSITLRALNIPPGPAYRQILKELRGAWLDGKIKTTAEEERYLKEFLEKMPKTISEKTRETS